MNQSPQTLVMNCHYNGLSLIQSLGRRGIQVVAVDSKRGIGAWSRYSRYLSVPDPGEDREGLVNELMSYGATLQHKALIIPTNDHWAEALAWGADRLDKYYRLCVADYNTVRLLLNKEKFTRWAISHDIQVPEIWTTEEALVSAKTLPYPVAIKINARRRSGQHKNNSQWSRIADRFRFMVCSNAVDLASAITETRLYNLPVFCQKAIDGKSDSMHSIGLYANSGEVLGLVYGKKIRGFPPEYGDCVVGQAEPVADWARALAIKICDLLQYTGFAEFDVIIDAKSGKRYLIEINPRSWGWVGITSPASVDLAWIAYQDMINGIVPDTTIEGCADGKSVYYARALADFQNCLLWYRFSNTPEWAMTPRAWWKTFRGKKGVFAEFSKDEPVIAIISVFQAIRLFLGNLIKVIRRVRFA